MASLRPPFRAEDMEGLYKAVTDGQFKKLPSHFSVDLNNLIKNMLKVNPAQRPSADKLLTSPVITKRLDQKLMIDSDEMDLNMLKTILLPNNILHLSDRLPNPNYDPIKTKLSSQFTKSTLLHLGDSTSKIGLEDQNEVIDNIKGRNASRSSSERKPQNRKNSGNNVMERIFNENATAPAKHGGLSPLPVAKQH
jgi:serine/threonine protein kinase